MKALIWDLDGTLVDSYKIIVRVAQEALKPYYKISKKDIHEHMIKNSVKHFFDTMSEKLTVSLETLYDHYHNFSNQVDMSEYQLMEGVKELLDTLSQKGYTHYIYTHRGLSTYNILKNHHILHYFKDIVTSDDGFSRKPEPDALLYLIQKYHLDKDTTYYIGDRTLDVKCGINAGVQTIYIGDEPGHGANHRFENVMDVKSIL